MSETVTPEGAKADLATELVRDLRDKWKHSEELCYTAADYIESCKKAGLETELACAREYGAIHDAARARIEALEAENERLRLEITLTTVTLDNVIHGESGTDALESAYDRLRAALKQD